MKIHELDAFTWLYSFFVFIVLLLSVYERPRTAEADDPKFKIADIVYADSDANTNRWIVVELHSKTNGQFQYTVLMINGMTKRNTADYNWKYIVNEDQLKETI